MLKLMDGRKLYFDDPDNISLSHEFGDIKLYYKIINKETLSELFKLNNMYSVVMINLIDTEVHQSLKIEVDEHGLQISTYNSVHYISKKDINDFLPSTTILDIIIFNRYIMLKDISNNLSVHKQLNEFDEQIDIKGLIVYKTPLDYKGSFNKYTIKEIKILSKTEIYRHIKENKNKVLIDMEDELMKCPHEIIINKQGELQWKEIHYDYDTINDDVMRLVQSGINKNDEVYRDYYRKLGYTLFGYWEIFYWDVNNYKCKDYDYDKSLNKIYSVDLVKQR